MTTQFTDSPEDLIAKALTWELPEHKTRETEDLIQSLARELRRSRAAQAGSASIIRDANVAYGELQAEAEGLRTLLHLHRGELARSRLSLLDRAAIRLNGVVQGVKDVVRGRR